MLSKIYHIEDMCFVVPELGFVKPVRFYGIGAGLSVFIHNLTILQNFRVKSTCLTKRRVGEHKSLKFRLTT